MIEITWLLCTGNSAGIMVGYQHFVLITLTHV